MLLWCGSFVFVGGWFCICVVFKVVWFSRLGLGFDSVFAWYLWCSLRGFRV